MSRTPTIISTKTPSKPPEPSDGNCSHMAVDPSENPSYRDILRDKTSLTSDYYPSKENKKDSGIQELTNEAIHLSLE